MPVISPCICGAGPEYIKARTRPWKYAERGLSGHIYCSKCGFMAPDGDSYEEAIDNWNECIANAGYMGDSELRNQYALNKQEIA